MMDLNDLSEASNITMDQVDSRDFSPKKSGRKKQRVSVGMSDLIKLNNPKLNIDDTDPLRLKSRVGPFLVVLFLVLCFSVAFLSLDWDDQHFHEAFAQDAHKLLEHINDQGSKNLESMASLGSMASITASATRALSSNSSSAWPFVTMPQLNTQAAHTLTIMNTSQVFLSPLVANEDRLQWESYATDHDHIWSDTRIPPEIFKIENGTTAKVADNGPGPFHPVWQIAPPDYSYDANFNLGSFPSISNALQAVHMSQGAVLTGPLPTTVEEQNMMDQLNIFSVPGQQEGEPLILMILPIFDDNQAVAAVLVAPFLFQSFLLNALGAESTGGVMVVMQACNQTHSYVLHQDNVVEYLGKGDQHHPFYSDLKMTSRFPIGLTHSADGIAFTQDFSCGQYELAVYPTAVYQNHATTNGPVIGTIFIVVLCVFFFLLFLFVGGNIHDQMEQLSEKAEATSHLVDTLFPKDVQDRLFHVVNGNGSRQPLLNKKQGDGAKKQLNIDLDDDPLSKLKELLDDADGVDSTSIPIADLFLNCTVMFADIQGFTAWSGCREPVQVFTLLETVFRAFDECAKKRNVFKVETIGDSYVAVCGLPTPNADHAQTMVRFATDCLSMMARKTRELEQYLGPDTGDLKLRIGLNSGPVTAGVLRGERGRFQLFGDTVNTAARMESNGVANRIHVSQETADCLNKAGKGHWLMRREDRVQAKGKGLLTTYFVAPSSQRLVTTSTCTTDEEDSSTCEEALTESLKRLDSIDDKTQRLIDWNTEVFAKILREIVAQRESVDLNQSLRSVTSRTSFTTATTRTSITGSSRTQTRVSDKGGGTLLDEVMDILQLDDPAPEANSEAVPRKERPLDPVVMDQLREFIRRISQLYHPENPFHNFDHASHVTMNCTKVLSRIKDSSSTNRDEEDLSNGVTSNPLTRFAICFGALIHDADHPGVTNNQLILEGSPLAVKYKNKSVAEQNSLELSLNLLKEEEFCDLYMEICPTVEDRRQFRAIVVNTVMATDIMDKELKEQRNARWERAFQGAGSDEVGRKNAKSTVVIEHLIQASDVSHTMQHWHVFRKWNQRLFEEMYKAYKEGRAEKDPITFWYQGELGFFDFYIIPLAKKLSDCGVFGVSSDEFLNYAYANRKEWEQKGREVVAEMMQKIRDDEESEQQDSGKSISVFRDDVLEDRVSSISV